MLVDVAFDLLAKEADILQSLSMPDWGSPLSACEQVGFGSERSEEGTNSAIRQLPCNQFFRGRYVAMPHGH